MMENFAGGAVFMGRIYEKMSFWRNFGISESATFKCKSIKLRFNAVFQYSNMGIYELCIVAKQLE